MREKVDARAGVRRSQRGAALIESLLVSSVLILCLVGTVYFRELSLKKLGAQRMARAAAIAHSMVGCKDSQPRAWLAKDGANYNIVGAPPTRTNIPNQKNDTGQTASDPGSLAPGLLSRVGKSGGSTSDGKGILNPITDARISRDVNVSTRAASLSKTDLSFRGEVGSQSFLSCGDEVKKDDYEAIVDMIRDELQSLKNAK